MESVSIANSLHQRLRALTPAAWRTLPVQTGLAPERLAVLRAGGMPTISEGALLALVLLPEA